MNKKRNDLYDLDFCLPKHIIQLSSFKIPILIHINKITFQRDIELDINIDTEMSYEYKKLKELENYKWYFRFINIEDKIFDNFSKTFLEYYNLETLDELLYILDEIDFNELVSHINPLINFVVDLYRERLYNMLKIDEKEPNIHLKDKYPMDKEIKEYLSYTSGYIISQMGIEFNPTIYFEENIGKAILQWSYRELELHMAYITAKSRFESVEDRWQAKVNQDIMDSAKR